MDRPELREALKRDFGKLYVHKYTTTWELDRITREIEIDTMSLDNTLALIPDEEEIRKDRPDREKIEGLIAKKFSKLMPDRFPNDWLSLNGAALTDQILALIPGEEEIRKEILKELEDEGLIAHEIKSYGASGRQCEEHCSGCKALKKAK